MRESPSERSHISEIKKFEELVGLPNLSIGEVAKSYGLDESEIPDDLRLSLNQFVDHVKNYHDVRLEYKTFLVKSIEAFTEMLVTDNLSQAVRNGINRDIVKYESKLEEIRTNTVPKSCYGFL